MAKASIQNFYRFIQLMEPMDVEVDQNYSALWFEMEIVYALILDEWESSGKMLDVGEIFSGKYLKDVCETVDAFVGHVISSK